MTMGISGWADAMGVAGSFAVGAVAVLAAVAVIGRIIRTMFRAMRRAGWVLDQLMSNPATGQPSALDRLVGRPATVGHPEVRSIFEDVAAIRVQVHPNGGGSLADGVNAIRADMARHAALPADVAHGHPRPVHQVEES